MMKRMHCGRAAESGVRMAQLAARDFTGPPTAIDGKFGLLEVYGGKTARPELLTEGLGRDWAMTSIFVKVYSCCSWIQGAVQQLVGVLAQRANFGDRRSEPFDADRPQRHCSGIASSTRIESSNASRVPRFVAVTRIFTGM